MAAPINRAAFLDAKDTPLRVADAPMPVAGPGEIVIRNHAIAINPVDWHMQDAGVFVQEWPAILGSDVAGEVFAVGEGVERFRVGERVVGHAITLVTAKSRDAAFQLYTAVPGSKAARLPANIPFTAAAALPLALEAAVAGFMLPEPGVGVFNIPTPALGLPLPRLNGDRTSSGKTIVIYGASSSVGAVAVQVAKASGTRVIALASEKNFDLVRECGADEVIDYHDADAVDKVIGALKSSANEAREFIGVYDTISIPSTYAFNLQILEKIGGGWLASTHPPPDNAPENVKVGMVLGVNDIAKSVWEEWVTGALERGELKCLPRQEVVGKELEAVQEGLRRSKEGVSAVKLVVEL